MNYPIISEYIEAIKASEDNFEELKHLHPVLDEDGEPVMTSGNFAVVFKMKDEQTGKLHAVKCFLKEQEGRAEAYRMIAEELEFVSSTFLTPIKYLNKELFVDSNASDETEFPVLLMDWVEGQTLDKYIQKYVYNYQRAENLDETTESEEKAVELLVNGYELENIAYQFSCLAIWLLQQPFAHGDLKPDNIIVKEDGRLVLVDYDGMYVPAMKGQKARELGSPDFRHPLRNENDFDEHIDDFPLSSILLSLLAIANEPSLFEKYGGDGRLLLSERDYRNIAESEVLDALRPLMADKNLTTYLSLFYLCSAQKLLFKESYHLFTLPEPEKPSLKLEEESLSTEVTEEDLANAWTDEYGAKYSKNGKRMLKGPQKEYDLYVIKKGTLTICNDCINCIQNRTIVIPSTVLNIGKSNFTGNGGVVKCESESFIVENELLLTKDKSRLIACLTHEKKVITIPKETHDIDEDAFFDEYYYHYDYENHLVFIIVQHDNINLFRTANCAVVVSDDKTKKKLTLKGFLDESIIVGGIFVDSYGVIYSENKTILLCFPRELECREYHVIEGCKEIHWFEGLCDPDEDGTVSIIGNKVKTLYLPSSINYINEDSLDACNLLESIKVPQGTRGFFLKLLPHYWTIIEEENYDSLRTEVTKEDLTTAWSDEKGVLYSADKKRLLKAPWHLKDYRILCGTEIVCDSAFTDSMLVKSVMFPIGLKVIGNSAFKRCGRLTSIEIPDSIISIGSDAFSGCRNLSMVSLPNSITKIGESAFAYCESLQTLSIPYNVTNIEEKTFYCCKTMSSISIPNNVNSIGISAFAGCESLKSLTIPNSTTKIGDNCFNYCKSLKEVIIPNSVELVGESAFMNCISLEKVVLPNKLKNISNALFCGCFSLRSITIPKNVSCIGNESFRNCTKLDSIIIPDTVTSIGDSAFRGCNNIKKIIIPENIIKIGINPFAQSGINNVVCKSEHFETDGDALYNKGKKLLISRYSDAKYYKIPDSVSNIGEHAFYNCYDSQIISIPNSVESAGDKVFFGSFLLKSVLIPRGTKNRFEKLLPECKYKLVEQ